MARSPHRTVYIACDPRQGAVAFNQLLSWDTSRVTDVSDMFKVRTSPRPAPTICSCSPLPGTLRSHSIARRACRLPARSPTRTVCLACDPRQHAEAFNQPLSWDTSRVKNMFSMLYVCCSPRPPAPRYLQS